MASYPMSSKTPRLTSSAAMRPRSSSVAWTRAAFGSTKLPSGLMKASGWSNCAATSGLHS
eukprot:10767515-Lingulodinium_polyedra.AAC.1